MLDARFMVALGLAIVLLLGLGYFFYSLQPTFAKDTPIEFKISKGESFRSIGARLSQHSLIKSISVFKFYSFLTGRATRFQPGIYELGYGMSVPQIVSHISTGGENEVRVTIPEGSTVKDIDYLLSKAGVLKEGDLENYNIDSLNEKYVFLNHTFNEFSVDMSILEGFLFPDTYRFNVDENPEKVVEVMLDNFEEKAWSLLKNRDNWYEDLILASFLEREIPSYEDRRIVAGILTKRNGSGIPLQIDATISYVKCNGAFLGCNKSDLNVVNNDLKTVSSPFNTYMKKGWTPTPISNPGEEAIKASINPKQSPYWYYLSAKDTGETIFSRTLQEHNLNRQRYL